MWVWRTICSNATRSAILQSTLSFVSSSFLLFPTPHIIPKKSSAWARPRSSSVSCRACYRSPPHPQPSFNRHLNHSPTTFQPPLVRFSPVVRPTFCRTHSPTSHPHFTYSAHTIPSPIRRADYPQPSFNRHLNHSPTTFQPPSNHHPHAHRPSLLPSVATRQDILIPPTPPPSPMSRPCNRNYPTLLAPLSLTNSFRCERRVIAMAQ